MTTAAQTRSARPSVGFACLVLGLSIAPVAARAQCDLKAEYIAPAATNLPGGEPLDLVLRFTNIAGTGQCAANQVRLRRTGSGAYAVGNTTGYRTLPALGPQASATLTFNESTPPKSGTHVYTPEFATPHNDADNSNHHPNKSVTYTATATLMPPDLMVAGVLVGGSGIRVGKCNVVVVRLKNAGGGFTATTQLTLAVVGPGTAATVATTTSVDIGGLVAGQQQDIHMKDVHVPQAGTWRFVALADAAKAVTESDETNNTGSLRLTDVQRPCSP